MARLTDTLLSLLKRSTAPRPQTLAPAGYPNDIGFISLQPFTDAVWSPRDYATFAREGMMQNPIVYRAVRMVAEAAASIPLILYDGETEVDTHPILSLLSAPSPALTGTDLLNAWYGFLLVSGNAYMEAVAVDGVVRELHVLRPDRMRANPGPNGWPESYSYTVGSSTVEFSGEAAPGIRSILHSRLFHPLNDYYGLSPLEAAAVAVDIHNAASSWNKALLDNAARPSGALVYSGGGHLPPEQFDRLKSELEQSFAGARNSGRPMLLEGGLDWKPLSFSPHELDFISAKNAVAREIALAIGVPPMLLGIPGDNTHANYQEANRAFWRQTVIPLVQRTASALVSWLGPMGPTANGMLTLKPDLDAIEGLSTEREALWARLEKSTFLTVNEKRSAVGYGPIDGGDHL